MSRLRRGGTLPGPHADRGWAVRQLLSHGERHALAAAAEYAAKNGNDATARLLRGPKTLARWHAVTGLMRDAVSPALARAAEGDVDGYVARVCGVELPEGATICAVAGGNHENYGAYGSPGPAQGLAYKDNSASISAAAQRKLVAAALVETMAASKP